MNIHSTKLKVWFIQLKSQSHILLIQLRLQSPLKQQPKNCLELTEIDQLVLQAPLILKFTCIQITKTTEWEEQVFTKFLKTEVKDAIKTLITKGEKELKLVEIYKCSIQFIILSVIATVLIFLESCIFNYMSNVMGLSALMLALIT